MRNPNQLKVDIDRLRYSADMAELRKWLCKILKNLTDGSGNEEAYERIDQLEQTLNETRVVFFADFLDNGTELQTSSPNVADSSNVYFFSNTGQFGYASLVVPSGTSYYSNFSNRILWADDTLSPYADKLYVCKSNRRIYAYIGGELVVVGGQELTIDAALSTTSENAVQNKAITAELNRLQDEIDSIETPTMREFDIDDETGCLMLTEVGRDDGTSFEIDEYGNFNVVVNE